MFNLYMKVVLCLVSTDDNFWVNLFIFGVNWVILGGFV